MSTRDNANKSEATGKAKKWNPYRKLRPLDLEGAKFGERKFSNQYDRVVFLLNRLGTKATLSAQLKGTCSQVKDMADIMKDEIEKYRELLTGVVLSDAGDDEEEGAEPVEKDDVAVSDEYVIKIFPFFESVLYKLHRLVSLIEFDEESSNVVALMIAFTSIEILPQLFEDLKKLVNPLEEVELWKSKNAANVTQSALDGDKRGILDSIVELLTKMKETEEGDELGISDDIDSLLEGIANAQEEAKKSDIILQEFHEDFRKLSKVISKACDAELCEIEDKMLLVDEDFKSAVRDDFGEVYKGTVMKDNAINHVLTKFVGFRESLSASSRRELQTELSKLYRLEHENITDFIGTCIKDTYLVLVWEYQRETLDIVLFNIQAKERHLDNMTNRMLINIASQILSALSFLHESGVIHQNLTTRSVFISKDKLLAKVGDFCFVDGRREVRKKQTGRDNENQDKKIVEFGLTYRAPESLQNYKNHNIPINVFASDIYSFGIILFELVEKKKAHAGATFEKFFKRMFAKEPRRPNYSKENIDILPKFIKDIIHRSWQQKPELRPTATALYEELVYQLADPEEEEAPPEDEENEEVSRRPRDTALLKWFEEVYIIEYDE